MNKKETRLRRAKRVRAHIRELGVPRLTVHRTPRHIYAQIIDATGGNVVASASSQSKDLRGELNYSGNSDAAAAVGAALAKKAVSAGITKVAFDRSGFKYHGRVKALADAARENGLQF
ncbi:50S ribosomal protein L18 [Granulosicoccaceae sp. 1_MG-2023]|nr:50S ribosomal protein L18 [Granulosicoccaceae sp. 1_MG-2023]